MVTAKDCIHCRSPKTLPVVLISDLVLCKPHYYKKRAEIEQRKIDAQKEEILRMKEYKQEVIRRALWPFLLAKV